MASKIYRSQPNDSKASPQFYSKITLGYITEFFWCVTGQVRDQQEIESQVAAGLAGLDRFGKLTFDIIVSSREELLTNDYQIVFLPGGEPYEANEMDVRGSQPGLQGPQVVLCCSRLGLDRITSQVDKEKSGIPQDPKIKRVVKPEVTLESLVARFDAART
jgi:hypothetical protein